MKNLALIGAGYWGKNLARNFYDLGVLRSVCDFSSEILLQIGAEYPEILTTQSIEEVLSDPSINRVAIAAPAAQHFELAKRALEAGKDVFVEKPLALDSDDGEALVNLAESRGLILMVGHLLQYHPCVRKIQQLLTCGEIGRLQYITSNRLNLGKIRREENALWSFAPHDISVILSLLGGELPYQVRCIGEAYLNQGVADVTLTTLRFPGGINAHVHVSWINPYKEQKLTVVGSHGMLVFDDTLLWNEKLRFYRQPLVWAGGQVPVANKSLGEAVGIKEDEPLRIECIHFLDCCDRRKSPTTDGREGMRVLQVLNAAQQSLDKNGEAFDPSRIASPALPDTFFSHPTAIIDLGAKIGGGTRIWHWSHICSGARIGRGVSIGQNVFIGNKVSIGDQCKIQNNVSVYDNVILEEGVFCGPSMVFTNVYNPRALIGRKDQYRDTLVKKGSTLGANCTVVCGITIGEYAFIGAGAVVKKDVKPYALMVGVPARQVGWMSQYGEQIPLPLEGSGEYMCPNTGASYSVSHSGVLSVREANEVASLL